MSKEGPSRLEHFLSDGLQLGICRRQQLSGSSTTIWEVDRSSASGAQSLLHVTVPKDVDEHVLVAVGSVLVLGNRRVSPRRLGLAQTSARETVVDHAVCKETFTRMVCFLERGDQLRLLSLVRLSVEHASKLLVVRLICSAKGMRLLFLKRIQESPRVHAARLLSFERVEQSVDVACFQSHLEARKRLLELIVRDIASSLTGERSHGLSELVRDPLSLSELADYVDQSVLDFKDGC